MFAQVLITVVILSLAAIVPTIALVGLRPVTIFLTPLGGAVLAAVAAELELGVGGTLLAWFIVLGILVNVLACWWFLRVLKPVSRGDGLNHQSIRTEIRERVLATWSWWSWLGLLVVLCAVLWPLQALRFPVIFDDGYGIWTLHSIFIYGGHQAFLNDLLNPAYRLSNPDYPPLVPASGALAFVVRGHIDLRLAVNVTSVLNACGLGVVGCGVIEAAGRRGTLVTRAATFAIAGVVCLIGFGLAGSYAVAGYADLLWAAAATGGILYGLVLPQAPRHAASALICIAVASLTKNEGLVTALIILGLLAARYLVPQRIAWRRIYRSSDDLANASCQRSKSQSTVAAMRGGAIVAVAMIIPGLAWVVLMKAHGINDNFAHGSHESVGQRIGPTVSGLSHNLHILPLALGVAIIGSLLLRAQRNRLELGNPCWLWLVVVGSLVAVAVTYLLGSYEIHWWLATSVSRTSIFARLTLFADMSIWLLVAIAGGESSERAASESRLDRDRSDALAVARTSQVEGELPG